MFAYFNVAWHISPSSYKVLPRITLAQGLPFHNANLWWWRFQPNVMSLTWIFHSLSQQGSVPHSSNAKIVVKTYSLSSPQCTHGIYCNRLFSTAFPNHASSKTTCIYLLHISSPISLHICASQVPPRSLCSQDNTRVFPIVLFHWEGN